MKNLIRRLLPTAVLALLVAGLYLQFERPPAGAPLPPSPEVAKAAPTSGGERARVAASSGGEQSAGVFERFAGWMKTVSAAGGELSAEALQEGVELARARQPQMAALLRGSPEAALGRAVRWSEWAALPPEVQALVEEPFSLTGDYEARTDCRTAAERRAEGPLHLTWLVTKVGSLKVFPTRAWAEVLGKTGVPVQGIRLGGEAVLRPGLVQVLDAGEAAAVAKLLPVRAGFAGDAVTVLAGGERLTFRDRATAERVADELRSALDLRSPGTVQAGLAVLYASSAEHPNGPAPGSIFAAAEGVANAFGDTPKNVLGLRLGFTDNANTPHTQAGLLAILSTSSDLIRDMAYGKTNLVSTVTPTVLILPNPAAFYVEKQGQLDTDAQAAAVAAGYVLANYDFYVYTCPPGTGGGANQSGKNVNMYDRTPVDVFVHELGHAYGLPHANFWVGQLAGGDFVPRNGVNTAYGPAGNDEYGDTFDLMAVQDRQAPGSDNVYPNGHFDMAAKALLGWIVPAAVSNPTVNGVYRICRFDHKDAAGIPGNALALKFRTASGETLWAGLRRNFSSNASLSTGAYLVWSDTATRHQQIDCNPLSRIEPSPLVPGYDLADLDREDSALPVGVSWTSPDGSVRLTNVGVGGTAPTEYLDLKVEFLSAVAPFGFYTNAAATTPGLTGSYYNSSLRAVNQPDWTATQTRTGVRVDNPPDFTTATWGVRSTVGVAGGTDADWDFFSVQWDGYVKVSPGAALQLATRSDDGSRLWVDVNGNGTFEANELGDNGWGTAHGVVVGNVSPVIPAGTYKIRVQYEEGNGGNSFQLVPFLRGASEFELYQDQNLTTYGLTSKYVNSSLRAVTSQADWSGSQTISGTRADPMPLYWDNNLGPRGTVGVTGGPGDGDWQNFSVQHDGWIKVVRRTRFLSYGADGTRFWIDTNNDGSFGASAPEFTTGNWGQNGVQRFGPFSGWVDPGTYRIRIQHEQDATGGNRWGFFGQNARQTVAGRGFTGNGATGFVSASAGAAVSGTFTVEAWVRPRTTSPMTFFSTRTPSADFGFTAKIQNGTSVLASIGTASSWANQNATGLVNYRANEWLHLACVVTPSTYQFYVNGWAAGNGALSATPVLFDATHPPTIGGDRRIGEYFNGDLDEVRVWTTARTAEEIVASFRRTLRGDEPNLASYWRLDEANGAATAADATAARPGTYTGSGLAAALESPVAVFGDVSSLIVTQPFDSGPGSLRQRIAEAFEGTTITFDPALSGQTISLTGGELVLSKGVTISGNSLPRGVTVSGSGASRIFSVAANVAATLESLTLRDGFTTDFGGAIYNGRGALTIRGCTITGNRADTGAGLFSDTDLSGVKTTLINSTLTGNIATTRGGGIWNNNGLTELLHCTISGNTAPAGEGGGVATYGDAFTRTTARHSIIAGNVAGDVDIAFGSTVSFLSTGSNLIGSGEAVSAFTQPGDLTNTAPLLAPLAPRGGPTETMPPLPGSPALDAPTASATTTDQRGFARSGAPDRGAVERGPILTVANNANTGAGSLRTTLAAVTVPDTRIQFAAALNGQTITLTSGELFIPGTMNVELDATTLAAGLTISGNGASRGFTSDGILSLQRLAIRNGSSPFGGGISSAGYLLANDSTFTANTAADFGGGLHLNSGTTDLLRCTISSNTTPGNAGAIWQQGAARTTLTNCTVAGNRTTGSGKIGGIVVLGGRMDLLHATITQNSGSGQGGGFFLQSPGVLGIQRSIIAGNTDIGGVAPDLHNTTGTVSVSGPSLIGNNASVTVQFPAGPLAGTTAALLDPHLAPLGSYGGLTQTVPPFANSAALGAAGTSPLASDQRGVVRGAAAELGSVEDVPAIVTAKGNSGAGTLRNALAAPFTASVSFDPAIFNGEPADTITLASELTLNRNVRLDASANTRGVTISGNNAARVFVVNNGATVSLDALSIVGGNSAGNAGAGILVDGGATLEIANCLIAENATTYVGGGLMIFGGAVTVSNSTFTRNSADSGAAIWAQGASSLKLTHTTVSGNTGSNAIQSFVGATLANSLVAGNSSGNFAESGTPVYLGTNFLSGAPLLMPLGNYGGPTRSLPPLPESPVVNAAAVLAGAPVTDQRGAPRPNGAAPDIGAVEYQPALVTSSANSGVGTLRDAIAQPFVSAIGFSVSGPITLGSELLLAKSLLIDASNVAAGVTVSGGNATRLFTVNSGETVSLRGLTLTGGKADEGGAILSDGALDLSRCTLSGNGAIFVGGAISSRLGSLTLTQCTLTGNTVTTSGVNYGGGAIFNLGTLALTHCTISGNTTATQNQGGGIINAGPATITNCIVSGNSVGPAGIGADLKNEGALTRVGANLIAANVDGNGGTSSGPAALTSPPLLAPLANYGGPTPTMALLPGSPARNAASGSTITTDQRGFPLSGPADLGAYEAGTLANYNAYIYETLPAAATAAQHATTFDFDGDSANNFDEWLALTDAANAASRFRVTTLARNGNAFSITFPTLTGRRYSAESSFDLVTWSPLGDFFPGTGVAETVTGQFPGATRVFLRPRVGP